MICQWFSRHTEHPKYKAYTYTYEACRIVSKDTDCQGNLEHCQYPTELEAQEKADAEDFKAEMEREERK